MTFPGYPRVIGPDGHELADWHLVTRHLAAAPPSWPPGTRFRYQTLSFGYLVGEVVRRVTGSTVGRLFAERVASPLQLDLWIGLPPGRLDRVAHLLPLRPDDQPRLARVEGAAYARARELVRSGQELAIEALPYAEVFLHPDAPDPANHLYRLMGDQVLQTAEVPGCNAIGTARSLCRLYAAILAGDVVSQASTAAFARPQPLTASGSGAMGLGYQLPTMATLDPLGELRVRPGPGTFGHFGTGGALGFADPRHGIAFGYLKNRMLRLPQGTADLVRAVYRCL
jgi:CubicO group peptidase (beta-lactamase class C family)